MQLHGSHRLMNRRILHGERERDLESTFVGLVRRVSINAVPQYNIVDADDNRGSYRHACMEKSVLQEGPKRE